MNLFDILGWRSDETYSINSKTSVGKYALTGGGGEPPVVTSNIYLGSTNITNLYYGSTPVVSVYYGSTQVF